MDNWDFLASRSSFCVLNGDTCVGVIASETLFTEQQFGASGFSESASFEFLKANRESIVRFDIRQTRAHAFGLPTLGLARRVSRADVRQKARWPTKLTVRIGVIVVRQERTIACIVVDRKCVLVFSLACLFRSTVKAQNPEILLSSSFFCMGKQHSSLAYRA